MPEGLKESCWEWQCIVVAQTHKLHLRSFPQQLQYLLLLVPVLLELFAFHHLNPQWLQDWLQLFVHRLIQMQQVDWMFERC